MAKLFLTAEGLIFVLLLALLVDAIRQRSRALFVIVISIIVLLALFIFTVREANALDLGQWEDTDPAIRHYYQHLMQPSNPAMSCCGVADAYWADSFEVAASGVFAIVTDDRDDAPLKRKHIDRGSRIFIPSDAIKFGPQDPQSIEENKNPTGHGIIFISRGGIVYCYVPPGGV